MADKLQVYPVRIKFKDSSQLINGDLYFKDDFLELELHPQTAGGYSARLAKVERYPLTSDSLSPDARDINASSDLLSLIKFWFRNRFSSRFWFRGQPDGLDLPIEYIRFPGLFNRDKRQSVAEAAGLKLPAKKNWWRRYGYFLLSFSTLYPALRSVYVEYSLFSMLVFGNFFCIMVALFSRKLHRQLADAPADYIPKLFWQVLALSLVVLIPVFHREVFIAIFAVLLVWLSLSIITKFAIMVRFAMLSVWLYMACLIPFQLMEYAIVGMNIVYHASQKGLVDLDFNRYQDGDEWKANTYTNNKLQFSFDKPGGWKARPQKGLDAIVNLSPGIELTTIFAAAEPENIINFIYIRGGMSRDNLVETLTRHINLRVSQGVIDDPEVVKFKYESFPIQGGLAYPIAADFIDSFTKKKMRQTFYVIPLQSGELLVEGTEQLKLDKDNNIVPSVSLDLVRKLKVWRIEKEKDIDNENPGPGV